MGVVSQQLKEPFGEGNPARADRQLDRDLDRVIRTDIPRWATDRRARVPTSDAHVVEIRAKCFAYACRLGKPNVNRQGDCYLCAH
jgi:hypothetical protein